MVPYSILIVDDDEKLCSLLCSYFKQEQCIVYGAADGMEAIQLLKRHEPQIMILDIMMPGMDGFEVCRRVRQFSDIPIIFLTAKDDETDRLIGLNIGADDYVSERNGQPIVLTPTEFNILEVLASSPDRVFSRMQLMEKAQGGYSFEGYERTIDTHVRNLRKKLEPNAAKPTYILTVYGIGYKFAGGTHETI